MGDVNNIEPKIIVTIINVLTTINMATILIIFAITHSVIKTSEIS